MRNLPFVSRPKAALGALALSASLLAVPGMASALPLGAMATAAKDAPSPIETVQWRGGWGGGGWRGGGPGWGGGGWRGGWGGGGWGGPGWRGGWAGGPGWGPGWGWNRPAVVVGPGWGWGGGWGGCGWGNCGWGPGAGFATGVIVGSAIAAQPQVVYGGPGPSNAVAYCMRRFRSYNPATGTYLGYDGLRHACP